MADVNLVSVKCSFKPGPRPPLSARITSGSLFGRPRIQSLAIGLEILIKSRRP